MLVNLKMKPIGHIHLTNFCCGIYIKYNVKAIRTYLDVVIHDRYGSNNKPTQLTL